MSIYFVYMYKDPINNIPFYVGYGKNKRHLDHLTEAKKDPIPKAAEHKLNKIRKILSTGNEPIIEIVQQNLDKLQATELEKELIKKFGTAYDGTGPLTNLTKGGDGGDTSNSEKYKSSMEKHHAERQNESYATYGMLGKKQSDNQKKQTQIRNQYPVSCLGVIYNSIEEARKALPGISIRKRIDSARYPDFFRLREKRVYKRKSH